MSPTKTPYRRDQPTKACRQRACESRNEACMTDTHHVLHSITGWGSHRPCKYELCRTDQKSSIYLLKDNVWLTFSLHLSSWKWRDRQTCLRTCFHLVLNTPLKTSVFIRHLFYNSGGTSNQDQATRAENNPNSLQGDKINWRVERVSQTL